MPIVHTADTDKTRLSCLFGGMNWVRDSRRQFSIYWRQNSFVLPGGERICELLVLTQFLNDMQCVTMETGSGQDKISSHRISRLDKTVSKFSVADSLVLSPIHCTRSHREHRQDKTRLVGVHGVNWIGDKTRLSATENFETVLSSLEMRCELSLVLSWPSFQFARNVVTYCDVIFGNWVKTSSQMCSVTLQMRLDKTVLSPI